MTRDEVVMRTQNVFRDIFNDADLVIYDTMTANDIGDWDSLNHINLLVALQQEFKIKFELIDIQQLRNVGEIISLILKKMTH